MVAALEAPVAVGRDERDQLSGRPAGGHDLDHERRRRARRGRAARAPSRRRRACGRPRRTRPRPGRRRTRSCRPAHSRQRATGQATGAPQRAQRGAASRGSELVQAGQTVAPGVRQTTQRRGSSRSSSTWRHGRAPRRTCLCRKWNKGVTSSAHGSRRPRSRRRRSRSAGAERPDHPFESWWGRWVVRPPRSGGRRQAGPPGPPPAA